MSFPILSWVDLDADRGGTSCSARGAAGTAGPMARILALVRAVAGLLAALPLWTHYDRVAGGFQFEELAACVAAFNSTSGWTASTVALIYQLHHHPAGRHRRWKVITSRVSQYMAAFLIHCSGLMNGVFAAVDGLLFYVFFEATLIPMFVIIGIWGGPNRVYASLKFSLIRWPASLLTLVALIYLSFAAGGSFALAVLRAAAAAGRGAIAIFLAFFAAFAVKVPMWPVHTWLPDAHVEAPTGGSSCWPPSC